MFPECGSTSTQGQNLTHRFYYRMYGYSYIISSLCTSEIQSLMMCYLTQPKHVAFLDHYNTVLHTK